MSFAFEIAIGLPKTTFAFFIPYTHSEQNLRITSSPEKSPHIHFTLGLSWKDNFVILNIKENNEFVLESNLSQRPALPSMSQQRQ